MTTGTPTIVEVVKDRALLGNVFDGPSWRLWVLLVAVAFGLAHGLTADEQAMAGALLGGRALPPSQVRELWAIVGRRGGKSQIAALIAIYLAAVRRYRLAPGEAATVMVIAADRRQARVVMRYVKGLLRASSLLAALIAHETSERIDLTTGVLIEIHTASFRSIRGYTVVGAVLDEVGYWPVDDAAEPDAEILHALRPAMATVPGSLLVVISSPYARRGELWRAYDRHYGQDGDVLVVKGTSLQLNPTIDPRVIEHALAEDEPSARAEWLAEFRSDLESFVSQEALDACVVPGRFELPPVPDVSYVAFVDPSGGSVDSMTLAVAHKEARDVVAVSVLDAVREVRPPFSPESAVRDFVELLVTYGVRTVVGDRYAGEWPREQFRKHGIEYRVSERTKSDVYRDALPLLNSGRVELVDHARLRAQLGSLERRTSRGGRDSFDHAPGAHDDLANAVAGVFVLASNGRAPGDLGITI